MLKLLLKCQGTISHHLYSINWEMILQESMELCRDLKDVHLLEEAVNKNKASLGFHFSAQWVSLYFCACINNLIINKDAKGKGKL